MLTDENDWKEMMIESGQMPDKNGYLHYNPEAIKNILKWMLEKDANIC